MSLNSAHKSNVSILYVISNDEINNKVMLIQRHLAPDANVQSKWTFLVVCRERERRYGATASNLLSV